MTSGRDPVRKRVPRSSTCVPAEHGFTLVETSVALLIMAAVMALVTTAIVHLTNTTLQVENTRTSADSLTIAFLDLDSQVRYANEIWSPYAGTPASDDTWDIEFESNYSGAAQNTCTELQYNYATGQLLRANWLVGATTAPSYKLLASGLSGTADPFQVISNPAFQEVQLMVTLSASSGSGYARETRSSSVTFTALNSTSNQPDSATDNSCSALNGGTATWTTA